MLVAGVQISSVAGVQISSVEHAGIIQLSMDSGSNLSMYHTTRLVECLAR